MRVVAVGQQRTTTNRQARRGLVLVVLSTRSSRLATTVDYDNCREESMEE